MTEQNKENIFDIIQQEGLDYALREYSKIFYEAKDAKLSQLVSEYIESYEEIEDYLDKLEIG